MKILEEPSKDFHVFTYSMKNAENCQRWQYKPAFWRPELLGILEAVLNKIENWCHVTHGHVTRYESQLEPNLGSTVLDSPAADLPRLMIW